MKNFAGPILLTAVAVSFPAQAQQTLYLAGYEGAFQTVMENEILPPFEAANNVKVIYVGGRSAETLAKLQAQQGNQEINVAIMDDGPMYQAIHFGFCSPVADAPVYGDVLEIARPANFAGNALGLGLAVTGIAYNTESFEKNGWAAPTSWNDLTDKKFEQRVASSPIGGTYGLHTLVMFARINGGGETNIAPGFDAIREGLAPNVLSWTASNDQLAQMFQSGDIDIAVWGNGRAVGLRNAGMPIEFVYPDEGAPTIAITACAVAGAALPEESQALLQHLVSPEVQVKFAQQGFGPTNTTTTLSDEIAADLPVSEDRVSKLLSVDWDVINENRAEWTNEWNRTVER